ncbi:hypothetical protein H7F15_13445 [Pontibacter sp. Tf4]|uniref:hypothetical protein n=1 Tax=Pontibacter sp. Tf4 TaxID=2761620 RepID=UPI00162436C6|nr:hypothetical protein [Pontibacter sp. Tf4]MBB6612049.1 hypothetical protein [Pontibacter sp. Tf4]
MQTNYSYYRKVGQISTAKVGQSGDGGAKWERLRIFAGMNHLTRHSILLLLALSIALGSVGVALGQQLCQMVMVESAALEEKSCCSASEASGEEDDCCKREVTYKKLDLVTTTKADLLAKVFTPSPALLPIVAPILPATTLTTQALSYSNSSPPPGGRNILLQKRTLQV